MRLSILMMLRKKFMSKELIEQEVHSERFRIEEGELLPAQAA